MTTDILPEGFDFTDPDVNWEAIPHEQFAALRRPRRCPGSSSRPSRATASPRRPAPATGP